jgi:hypothetical protein
VTRLVTRRNFSEEPALLPRARARPPPGRRGRRDPPGRPGWGPGPCPRLHWQVPLMGLGPGPVQRAVPTGPRARLTPPRWHWQLEAQPGRSLCLCHGSSHGSGPTLRPGRRGPAGGRAAMPGPCHAGGLLPPIILRSSSGDAQAGRLAPGPVPGRPGRSYRPRLPDCQ